MLNKTINGYTIKRPLGEGGMAEVWYAENGIGKAAAVKFLKEKFCKDETVVERFRNEAMVMVKLSHPNIRQVYDYATVEGRPCIIMEYLEGNDLKARLLKGERFTDSRLRAWWNQLADALNYTHQQGVIHRDIKPSNIFIDKYDNVKLMDFGIAKIEEYGGHTQTGVAMGTRIYMSPEQVRDPKRVKDSTDAYSLAVTFVHLLTGKAPYDTTTTSDFDIQMAIVQEPLDLSSLSEEWQSFLQPYLLKKPEERPELRAFSTTTASPKKEKHTSDDETIVEPTATPKPKVSQQPQKEQPQVTNEDKKSQILMWTTGVMMAATELLLVLMFIIGNSYLLLSVIITFLTINIAFLLQLKHRKSKLLIAASAVVLLSLQNIDIGGYPISLFSPVTLLYSPVLITAVGMEGYIFAKRYGRIKWIHAALAISTLVLSGIFIIQKYIYFIQEYPY